MSCMDPKDFIKFQFELKVPWLYANLIFLAHIMYQKHTRLLYRLEFY